MRFFHPGDGGIGFVGGPGGDVDGGVQGVEEASEFAADAGGGTGYDVDFSREGGEGGFGEGWGRWEGLTELLAHDDVEVGCELGELGVGVAV
jgi:hypothetical protein